MRKSEVLFENFHVEQLADDAESKALAHEQGGAAAA
jgi:hypothetical protein